MKTLTELRAIAEKAKAKIHPDTFPCLNAAMNPETTLKLLDTVEKLVATLQDQLCPLGCGEWGTKEGNCDGCVALMELQATWGEK